MRKIIIDTNCLISFVSDRNPAQQEEIATLFDQAGKLKKMIVCHHHVISEFVYVLTSVYSVNAKTVRQMITDLIAIPGVVYTPEVDMGSILTLWPEKIPDFGDAVLAAYCMNTKGTTIATFDKKFRNNLNRLGIPFYM